MIKSKSLQTLLLLSTVVLVTSICAAFIPARLRAIALERITLSNITSEYYNYAVYLNEGIGLSVSFSPAAAHCNIEWSSADESIVSVSGDGVLTGNRLGSTTVTARGEDGVSEDFTVDVIRKPLAPDSDLPEKYYDKILIANTDNQLEPVDYEPEVVNFPAYIKVNKPGMQIGPVTLEAYTKLVKAAKQATGLDLVVISGYRSYRKQKQLYDEDVAAFMSRGYSRAEAQRLTERTTNKPGCSEHQLGDSLDIGNGASLEPNFGATKLGRWVTEHAHEYGFILRYPADKVDKTSIDYEAWHFRYVGVEHATYIFRHGLCLEEYVAMQELARQAAEDYAATISASDYSRALDPAQAAENEQRD